jgi:hypothetical protein
MNDDELITNDESGDDLTEEELNQYALERAKAAFPEMFQAPAPAAAPAAEPPAATGDFMDELFQTLEQKRWAAERDRQGMIPGLVAAAAAAIPGISETTKSQLSAQLASMPLEQLRQVQASGTHIVLGWALHGQDLASNGGKPSATKPVARGAAGAPVTPSASPGYVPKYESDSMEENRAADLFRDAFADIYNDPAELETAIAQAMRGR